MTWWQGLLTVSLGNFIVLIPILLNSHAGHEVRHPVPGARAVELRHPRRERRRDGACARRLRLVRHPDVDRRAGARHADDDAVVAAGPTSSGHKAIAFGVFWLVQVAIILRGIEGIKFLESYAAPLLLGSSVALLIWALQRGRRDRQRVLGVVEADRATTRASGCCSARASRPTSATGSRCR